MLKIYDVECLECGHVYEQWVENNEFQPCEKCGKEVKKIMSNKFTFELKYNNKTDMCGWSNSGYASSSYWNDVNKERAKGKDVEAKKW